MSSWQTPGSDMPPQQGWANQPPPLHGGTVPAGSTLTQADVARMELNRAAALERRRAANARNATPYSTYNPPQAAPSFPIAPTPMHAPRPPAPPAGQWGPQAWQQPHAMVSATPDPQNNTASYVLPPSAPQPGGYLALFSSSPASAQWQAGPYQQPMPTPHPRGPASLAPTPQAWSGWQATQPNPCPQGHSHQMTTAVPSTLPQPTMHMHMQNQNQCTSPVGPTYSDPFAAAASQPFIGVSNVPTSKNAHGARKGPVAVTSSTVPRQRQGTKRAAPEPIKIGAGAMKKLDASAYGPATTMTLGPPLREGSPRKKLTQATLFDTMRRHRAAKEATTTSAGEQEEQQQHQEMAEEEQSGDVGRGNFFDKAAHEAAVPPLTLFGSHSVPLSPLGGAPRSVAKQAPQQPLLSLQTPAVRAARKAQARSILAGSLGSPDIEDAQESAERWNWLKARRDAQGHDTDHPSYDPRSLLISSEEFGRLRGFNRQYWKIKRDAMDLVLFVRVGSFYELYDTDADVGLRVGLNPMGTGREANMWRVGCHAGSFQRWAARVLALGYCVGRVDECRGKRDNDPACSKLVARRLVQVYTPGTALDWGTSTMSGDAPGESEDGLQPFVALFEGTNGLLGACAVDVPSCTLALAQWQEVDAGRSTLRTLLTQINPSEVVAISRAELSLDTRKALRLHRPLVADGVERKLTTSYLRRFVLSHDPECSEHVPGLMHSTEAAYFALGGYDAAFKEAAAALCGMPHAAAALQMALSHLQSTGVARHVLPNASISAMASFTLDGARRTGQMLLDATAAASLEVIEGSLGGVSGSLLAFLSNGAATAAGKRRIRQWLCAPLYRVGDIEERLDTVQAFMKLPEAAGMFQRALRRAPDCERLLPKAAVLMAEVAEDRVMSDLDGGCEAGEEGVGGDSHQPQEEGGATQMEISVTWARFAPVVRFLEGLDTILEAVDGLGKTVSAAIPGGVKSLPPIARTLRYGMEVADAVASLQLMFHPGRLAEGGGDNLALEPGLYADYDAASAEVEASQDNLRMVVDHERKILLETAALGPAAAAAAGRKVKLVHTGAETLLEVPIALKPHAPPEYILKKETKTVVRYTVPAIIVAAERVSAAQATSQSVVLHHMRHLASFFLEQYPSFLAFCSAVASLDALAAFAETTHPEASVPGCAFCRPVFDALASPDGPAPRLHFEGLWNPQLLLSNAASSMKNKNNDNSSDEIYIQANDLVLGDGVAPSATLLLTGANTGGKSTLLRSACLAVIMAQVGCFVPCTVAELAPVDRIFTRMGAQDRLAAGESTFCVEMTETAAVLRHAQRSSLVVLDELGRGTSTHDGAAIATAVAHWLTSTARCRVLFATHYHGLTREASLIKAGSALGHMESSVDEGGLVPSYRLCPGPAPDGSCGIKVAAVAGLPGGLVERAEEMARVLEGADKGHQVATAVERLRMKLMGVLGSMAGGKKTVSLDHLLDLQAAVKGTLLVEC